MVASGLLVVDGLELDVAGRDSSEQSWCQGNIPALMKLGTDIK